MESHLCIGLNVAFFCAILQIAAAHRQGHGHGRYQTPLTECNRDDINGLRQCCKLPTVFNKTLVENCTYVAQVFYHGGRGKRHNNGGSRMRRHYTCAAECILKGQGISNESTGVNIIKLKEQMYAASNANWKPIINTTIDGCWANLTNVSSSIPPAANGECTSKSDMLLMCVHRNFTVNCPAAEKTTSANDPTCVSRCKNLRSCDPYASAKNYRSRGVNEMNLSVLIFHMI